MRPTLKDRIDEALKDGPLLYYDLAERVWPHDKYPNSWRNANHGGPPGLVMTLSFAIRRYGYRTTFTGRGFTCQTTVHPR